MPKPITAPSKKKHGRFSTVDFSKPGALVCLGKDALRYEDAKELLGWQEEEKGKKLSDFLLKKLDGIRVQCTHNVRNRNIITSNVQTLMQEILRGRWQYNGETVIIGKQQAVLNGQHQLCGFVLAVESWRKDPDAYPYWKKEPILEKLVAIGVEEVDTVVNTMDTCKPRTLADVIFRSVYFEKLNKVERQKAAHATEHCVRCLWSRTNAGLDAYSPRRTHSESVDFIQRHSRLLQAVSTVLDAYAENEGALKKFMPSVGKAAGFLFLMGSSGSTGGEYLKSSKPNEEMLNWDNWDKSVDFFTELASGKLYKTVKAALTKAYSMGETPSELPYAVVIKAWHAFSQGKTPTPDSIIPKMSMKDDDLGLTLDEFPLIGGIDFADGSAAVEEEEPDEATQNEIEERVKAVRTKRQEKEKPKEDIDDEKEIWVVPDPVTPESSWRGVIVGKRLDKVQVKVANGFVGAGTVYDVEASQVQESSPFE